MVTRIEVIEGLNGSSGENWLERNVFVWIREREREREREETITHKYIAF